jgi:hypothetical protein
MAVCVVTDRMFTESKMTRFVFMNVKTTGITVRQFKVGGFLSYG